MTRLNISCKTKYDLRLYFTIQIILQAALSTLSRYMEYDFYKFYNFLNKGVFDFFVC